MVCSSFYKKLKLVLNNFFYHMSLAQRTTVKVYFSKEKIIIVDLVKLL
jgi:hypothetical protein